MKSRAAIWGSLYAVSLFAAGGASAATYHITWLLGHKNLDYFEEAAVAFKQDVERESKGDIAVDIRARVDDEARPGDDPEISAKVAKGEAEMGHSFVDVMGAIDPRMHAFEDPFLFRGYRHMEGVFEGPVGKDLLEGLRQKGVVGLSFTYSGGACGIATTDREVRRPEDLKGLKVGVYGDGVNQAWLESLGAKAVPIRHDLDKIVPMTRNGELDAVVTTWRNFDRADLANEFRHVGLMGSTYLVSVTYVNPKFYDSLPKKYQELLARASREAGRIERARTIQLNASARRGMTEDRGVRSAPMTSADQTAFASALAPSHEAIERIIGKDLAERIRNTPDAPEFPSIDTKLARR